MNTFRKTSDGTFPSIERPVLLAALAAGLISALLYFLARHSLWEDEIIAFTHGLQPMPTFFVEILRNDIHPFGYFLLLKGWASVAPDSDKWLLASSFLSAFISLIVITYVTRAHYGSRAALWVAALFVVMPNFAWAAGNLRMYGLLPGLIVLAWHANVRFLQSGERRWLIALLLLEITLIYTHIIEFFFVGIVALGALVSELMQTRKEVLRKWILAHGLSFLAALPILGIAIIRGSEPLPTPDLFSLFKMPAQLISGWQLSSDTLFLVVGGGIFFGLLSLSLISHKARLPTLLIVCGAMIISMIVALIGKPIFKPPIFTANLVPFLIMGAASGIVTSKARLLTAVALSATVAMSVATFFWSAQLIPRQSFKPAAEHIASNVRPGDLVVAPNPSVFWGVLRYAVAATWGQPLEVMPLTDNPAWTGLKRKLGTDLVNLLGLSPHRDYVDHLGVRYVITNDISASHFTQGTIWVVLRNRYPEVVNVGRPILVSDVQWFNREISVTKLTTTQSGFTSVSNPPEPPEN